MGAFFLNTAFAVVQVGCQSGGLYGLYQPGKGPSWAPSVDDLANSPNELVMRSLVPPPGGPQAHPPWAVEVPDRPFTIGSLLGGPGAYLAMGSLGLPLALALTLQLIAPRGSREELWARLGDSGQGPLVVLLCGMLLAASVLTGFLAGSLASVPFALGLVFAGFPAARGTGLRWSAIGLTCAVLMGLGAGVVTGMVWARLPDTPPPVLPVDLSASSQVWSDALPILADFPILGTGLGSFAAVAPFYKSRDAATTSALSSLLQWCVESGGVGLSLLLLGAGWCLVRLPVAVRRVGDGGPFARLRLDRCGGQL